ncbi:MAG: sugar phosphate isomerase/epimerase family protein [Sphaerochaetaceae bacterium]|nr:sugar phosphate isomerase/epimerase [Spirochaetales bacterium]MDY5499984.1 sugar phosphate isomerase/epimerase family protein [Sphaerochaetaceae bacterium]
MRIATSTNLVSFRPDGGKTPMVDLFPIYAEAGFTLLDLNWCEMMNPKCELNGEYWRLYAERILHAKDRHRLAFNQSHAPYARHIGDHSYDLRMLRCFDLDVMLGIPLIVIHPLASDHDPIEDNLSFLAPFVEKAEQTGVRVALENLEGTGEIQRADDLLELVRRLGSRQVGVCLDTGHAWMRGLNLAQEIRTYGKKLWATHIADNHGSADEHLLPFHGTIDWKSVISSLEEIGYQGDLTFECMKENARLPSSLRKAAVSYALAVGNSLLEI